MDTTPSQAGTTPVVTVRGLTKTYGGRRVVDGLQLDIHAGEILGLIGANGAGKTTTVEIIQGLRRADSGAVRVLGIDPGRHPDRVRHLIGSQLQDSGLPDRLRVFEAVRLFAGPEAADGEDLLERFGLGGRRRSPFATMSGGERQRLFLVLALLNRPRLVILDELTQGLDPSARREVWAAIQQLRAGGTTVLLVTHELEEAEALCDRVVAMREGRVLDAGTPADLIARHAGTAVISFAADAVPSASLDGLRRVTGVESAVVSGGQVLVRGRREAIAHVGSWLVSVADSVPADLRVQTPSLEDAFLTLLGSTDRPDAHGVPPTPEAA